MRRNFVRQSIMTVTWSNWRRRKPRGEKNSMLRRNKCSFTKLIPRVRSHWKRSQKYTDYNCFHINHIQPDLCHSGFYLFADLKHILTDKRFESNEEVIAKPEAYFADRWIILQERYWNARNTLQWLYHCWRNKVKFVADVLSK